MAFSTQKDSGPRFRTWAVAERIRRNFNSSQVAFAAALVLQLNIGAVAKGCSPGSGTTQTNKPIPYSVLGARATAQYSGDGLALIVSEKGVVQLRCVFQRLEGEVTTKGLWLKSTVPNKPQDRFQVVTDYLGRDGAAMVALPECGRPSVTGGQAQYARLGLVEEYSVSVDGVQQDVVVANSPGGAGPLRVEMSADGARVEEAAGGVGLTLEKSGRKLAYSGLQVIDAVGKKLSARIEVMCPNRLAVVVDDRGASYPVRIDPTFSDANWVGMGGPTAESSTVLAAAVDGFGNLYVGGSFTVVGTVAANNVAKWDGSSWSSLATGMNGGNPTLVNALAVSGTNLYAGGSFTSAGGVQATNIAEWNGSSWSALGSGMNGVVNALAASGTDLYAGGTFTTAGGISANNIAKWTGSTWSPLGSGMNGGVNVLQFFRGLLHAGGSFSTAGGVPANSIAEWQGNSWTNLSSGITGVIYALTVWGTNLYVGGEFTSTGNVARWDGNNWFALGSGLTFRSGSGVYPPVVYALAVSGTNLYAGGTFTMAGPVWVNFIAQWNGSIWWVLSGGADLDGYVHAMAVYGTALYVGGSFTTANGIPANAIAKWDGTSWSTLGNASFVYSLALSGTDLYAAGYFTKLGGVSATNIAKWDGSSWSAIPLPGLIQYENYLGPLAVSGTNLYVVGFLTQTNTGNLYDVAQWNGSSWSTLGSGIIFPISALAASGTNVYAGNTSVGALGTNYVARWDGNSWSALGSAMYDPEGAVVNALAASGTHVYAGGRFQTAGGVSATNIAEWNGSSWSPLGSGLLGGYNSYNVYALAASGTDLYAGGMFTNAGGISANNIAKWNGSSWSALGSGIGGSPVGSEPIVIGLAVSGANLYVGGAFTEAGGVSATNIAKWDGSSWSSLGSGMNGPPVLVASGADLYAGGGFTTVGGKPIAYVAKARIGSVASSIAASSATAAIGFFGVVGYQYDVQRANNLVAPVIWTTITTSPLSPAADGSFSFTDLSAPTGMAYYRSVEH